MGHKNKVRALMNYKVEHNLPMTRTSKTKYLQNSTSGFLTYEEVKVLSFREKEKGQTNNPSVFVDFVHNRIIAETVIIVSCPITERQKSSVGTCKFFGRPVVMRRDL